MKISCPSCAAKYSIADDKVENRLAKIRCRKCSTTIVIDGKVNPPSVYAADASSVQAEQPSFAAAASGPAAAAAPAGGGREYSVDFGDNDQRNMQLHELIEAYNAGQVTAETYIWAEGMADWTALGEVPEIVEALHGASAPAEVAPAPEPAPVAAPAPAPTPSPFAAPAAAAAPAPDFSGGAAPWDQGAAADAVRAATAPGRSATADLFGGFDQAGGEADVATSAPAPAVASAPTADPATGARNESSVLFSLSALTAARDSSSPGQSGGGTREDSGLIDLKALTSQAEASAPAADPIAAPVPLGFAPPLGSAPLGGGLAQAQLSVPPPQHKSKTGLFIGAGIAFAAIVIAVAIIVTSSKEAPPPPPTAAATPAPAPTPAPTPTPEATVAAKPPATGTADENGEKPPDKPSGTAKRYTGPVGKPKPGAAAAPKPGPAAAPKPAPKPKSACGCPPGDLQCAMRCAAGG
ncbi:MAG: zinc-ribbon domain-containing protein [Polyangiaceae bacterium]